MADSVNYQQELWREYQSAQEARDRIAILKELRLNEETVARIRGLVINKHIAAVVDAVKLYDFTDKYPSAIELDGSGNAKAITDGIELPSQAVEPDDAVFDTGMGHIDRKHALGDYGAKRKREARDDDDTQTVMLPNGVEVVMPT